jgi:hypothetical protein
VSRPATVQQDVAQVGSLAWRRQLADNLSKKQTEWHD